jgi:hypothetical protein
VTENSLAHPARPEPDVSHHSKCTVKIVLGILLGSLPIAVPAAARWAARERQRVYFVVV